MSKRLMLVLALAFVIGLVLWIARSRWWPGFKTWLFEAVSPVNLAIFRIILFSLILTAGDGDRFRFFVGLPQELVYPPELMSWVPLDPIRNAAGPILVAFQVATFLAILGAWTRVSTAVSTLTGLVVLGLPNWYGKVNHSHHLLWLAAILSVAPCAHALSFDGVAAAMKRADRGDVARPAADAAYGVPLKLLVLLLGLVYFFPGFYKLFTVGPSWMKADEVRMVMHLDWDRMGHWLPPVRLDDSGILLTIGAAMTIGFELLFLPLALWNRTRPLAAIGGLLFHNMTYLNLGIRFGTVQWLYAGFVDWAKVFAKLGTRLSPLYVLYDGDCRFCRRAIATLGSIDVLAAFTTINFRADGFPPELTPVPDVTTLDRDIHAWDGTRWTRAPQLSSVWSVDSRCSGLSGRSWLCRACGHWRHPCIG